LRCIAHRTKTQDGRRPRRYAPVDRRRFFAWLQWKRRLLVRWEYYASNFLGFVQLGCISMLLRQF
jgi:transposase